MFKIQVLNTITPTGLKLFPKELYDISADMKDPDAILVRSHVMHDMVLPKSVKVVGRAGAGVNNIPVAQLTEQGIPVLNTPGANANAVKELVIAGMLLASRNLYNSLDYLRHLTSDNDTELNAQIEQDKKQFVGHELLGKTLGVIGLGSIGVKVANAGLNLGMRIIGYDPTITINRAWELSSSVEQARSLEYLLRESDFVSVHVPLMPDTKNLLDVTQLELMKDNAVLLNFSREGIVNNEAILKSVHSKSLFYVTDFPSRDLKACPRIICLPHLGASTVQAEENCAVMLVKQIRDFLELGLISNAVNFPSVDIPTNHATVRLAIVNKNIPNMVAQISAKLAEKKINIVSLMNKSQDDIAYTLVDINTDIDETLLAEITKIAGIIRVRKVMT